MASVVRVALIILALVGSIHAFLVAHHIPSWVSVALRIPYHGETLRKVPVHIAIDGAYEIQLEVGKKPGEGIPGPKTPPLIARAFRGTNEVTLAEESAWYGGEAVNFSSYYFLAKTGDRVLIDVKPGASLGTYRSHPLSLVVQRDISDYGVVLWRKFGWGLQGALLAVAALGLMIWELMVWRKRRSSGRSSRA